MAAGGRAGKSATPPLAFPLPGTVELGRDEGADDGLEFGVDDGPTHGTVVILPVYCVFEDDGAGRSGNGFADEETPEAVPQDRVCETWERDDCAVDDFNFKTFDFLAPETGAGAAEDEEDVTAQLRGMEPADVLVPAGREG